MDVLSLFNMDVFYFYTAPRDVPISGRIIKKGMEIVEIILEGEVLFHSNGKMEVFGRGAMFWHVMDDYTVHISVPGKTYTCIAFQFLARHPRTVPRISRWHDLSTLDTFIQQIMRTRRAENCDIAQLEEACRGMLQWNAYLSNTEKNRTKYPAPLERVISMLRDNIQSNMSIEELASKTGISIPYIFVLFREHIGKTPHAYFTELRLRHAEMLLGRSNIPIKEIASQCGFTHLEVFYRTFKRRYGVTPAEFRTTHENSLLI